MDSAKASTRAIIPLGDMAKADLPKLFPHLTPLQVAAIREGKPVPPSPDWQAPVAVANYHERMLDWFARIDNDYGSVLCVLVFGVRERIKLARKAVNQFVAQRYPLKHLVIVNGTDLPVTTHPHALIKEMKVEPYLTIAEMRNIGINSSRSTWIKPNWDDDDVYDPYLLSYMMAHSTADDTGDGPCLALTHQLRVDITSGTAFMHTNPAGIPNTMIVPRETGETIAFPSDADDAEYLAKKAASTKRPITTIANVGFPLNCLSMSVFHGHNFMSADVHMGDNIGDEHAGRWYLGMAEKDQLRDKLSTFGFQIKVIESKPEEVPA